VGYNTTLTFYDQTTLDEKQTIEVHNCKNDPNLRILYMIASKGDCRVGIALGTKDSKDHDTVTEIITY
jgi:hypothetical protein